MDSKNQIDVAMEIEEVLNNSGLEWEMAFNPEEKVYYFKLKNHAVNTESAK